MPAVTGGPHGMCSGQQCASLWPAGPRAPTDLVARVPPLLPSPSPPPAPPAPSTPTRLWASLRSCYTHPLWRLLRDCFILVRLVTLALRRLQATRPDVLAPELQPLPTPAVCATYSRGQGWGGGGAAAQPPEPLPSASQASPLLGLLRNTHSWQPEDAGPAPRCTPVSLGCHVQHLSAV